MFEKCGEKDVTTGSKTLLLTQTLLRLGWEKVGAFRDSVEYWELPNGKRGNELTKKRILVPLREDASDFEDLLRDAYAQIEASL